MPAVSICGVGYCDRVAQSENIKTALNTRMKDLLEKIKCLQIICRHILCRVLSVIQRIFLIMCQDCKIQIPYTHFLKLLAKRRNMHHICGLGIDAAKCCIYEYIRHCSRLGNTVCMRCTFPYLAKSSIACSRFFFIHSRF